MAQFEEDRMDNWKQFHGTELGSLLGSIYGGNKPVIKYPKIKRREATQEEQKMFRPVCNKPTDFDPTHSTRQIHREKSLAVPKLCGRRASTDNLDDENVLPIQYISRRKSGSLIMKELDDIKMKQSYYRPAYVQPFSSEAEKDKLSQIFTHKGGKALPGELIAAVSEAPFERAARKLGEDKMIEFKMRRGLSIISSDQSSNSSKKLLSANEQLLEQITSEIHERQTYIESMQSAGGFSKAEENQIKSEIAQRLNELKKLQKSA